MKCPALLGTLISLNCLTTVFGQNEVTSPSAAPEFDGHFPRAPVGGPLAIEILAMI